MGDEAQKEISNMGNYFCKLHLLVNFAEEVGKGFKVYESITFDQFKPMCAFDLPALTKTTFIRECAVSANCIVNSLPLIKL
jgi:hypothetical protein